MTDKVKYQYLIIADSPTHQDLQGLQCNTILKMHSNHDYNRYNVIIRKWSFSTFGKVFKSLCCRQM